MNNSSLIILIVEDNRGDIALIEGYLGEYLPVPEIVGPFLWEQSAEVASIFTRLLPGQ